MNESKECIVSVAFREPYLRHSANQERAIKMLCPDVDLIYFRDELPTKDGIIKGDTGKIVSHFQSSLYGFKPHAIKYAYDLGYRKIVWLDPSVLPLTSPKVLMDSLDEYPMITRSGEHGILEMTNQKAKDYFGFNSYNDTFLKLYRHIGGTIYGFNFNDKRIEEVFRLWKKAEEDGIFGTQDDFMKGHWADESCMVFCMYNQDIKTNWVPDFKYLNQKEM